MGLVEFDWDDLKEAANINKHGVDFWEAQTVFFDPLSVTLLDATDPSKEERFVTIGASAKSRLLLVVYAEKVEGVIRIISARVPTSKERKTYEEGI